MRVPKLHKAVNTFGIGPQIPGGIVASASQFGGLSQVTEITDQLTERHAMGHGAQVFLVRPSVMRDALTAQVVDENQQIEVLKMAEDALDDGIVFCHRSVQKNSRLIYSTLFYRRLGHSIFSWATPEVLAAWYFVVAVSLARENNEQDSWED